MFRKKGDGGKTAVYMPKPEVAADIARLEHYNLQELRALVESYVKFGNEAK
jgi:hypothetical protein